jgi:hypothetical protein
MAAHIIPFPHKGESTATWIVLMDGKRLQVFEKNQDINPLFEEPLNTEQLQHELMWHYHQQAPYGGFMLHVKSLLLHAYQHNFFGSLIIVAPETIADDLKKILPKALLNTIERSICKNLTYCPRQAIKSYFEVIPTNR